MAVIRCHYKDCKQPLQDEENFCKHNGITRGRQYFCNDCVKEYKKKQRRDASPEWRASQREYGRKRRYSPAGRAKLQERMREPISRFRTGVCMAKRRKLSWGLSFDVWKSLVIGSACHYCHRQINETGHSLDRKDNSLGYELENVVPCCGRCNKARYNAFSYEEFLTEIAPAIRRIDAARVNYK